MKRFKPGDGTPSARDAASRPVFLRYTQEELDKAYDQSAWAPQMAELEAQDGEASAVARQRMPSRTEQYGPSGADLVDIFTPAGARGAPVLVFIHGGAWTRNSRQDVLIRRRFWSSAARFIWLPTLAV